MISVLLLTHQRRAALAAWTHLDSSAFPLLPSTSGVWSEVGFEARVGESNTAEELASLYQEIVAFLLNKSLANLAENVRPEVEMSQKRPDAFVENLYFCVGPGSFTGLRLGAAFSNGLLLGRSRKSFALRNPDSAIELEQNADQPLGVRELNWALDHVCAGQFEEVVFFEPHYGREPGPVLKLRGTNTTSE